MAPLVSTVQRKPALLHLLDTLATLKDLTLVPSTSAEMGESNQLFPSHIHVVMGTQCNLNLSEIRSLNCVRLSEATQSRRQLYQGLQQVNLLQRVYKGLQSNSGWHSACTWRPSKGLQQSLLGVLRSWQVPGGMRMGIKLWMQARLKMPIFWEREQTAKCKRNQWTPAWDVQWGSHSRVEGGRVWCKGLGSSLKQNPAHSLGRRSV